MSTGTPKVIGFYMTTQRPLDERYLNEGVPYADEAEVLATIPLLSRHQYMTVNISGSEYWFLADKTTLVSKVLSNNQDAADVAITDTGELFDADNVEDALAEVKSQANATDAAIAGMTGTEQSLFTITLGAYSTVAARVAAAVAGTNYPTGWTIAANSSVNLLVTHNLTGRKVTGVNVFEIDGSNERLLPPFASGYSGLLVNGLTALIEGLAPTLLALRIEIFVNL